MSFLSRICCQPLQDTNDTIADVITASGSVISSPRVSSAPATPRSGVHSRSGVHYTAGVQIAPAPLILTQRILVQLADTLAVPSQAALRFRASLNPSVDVEVNVE